VQPFGVVAGGDEQRRGGVGADAGRTEQLRCNVVPERGASLVEVAISASRNTRRRTRMRSDSLVTVSTRESLPGRIAAQTSRC
jgi:hypothetical protein